MMYPRFLKVALGDGWVCFRVVPLFFGGLALSEKGFFVLEDLLVSEEGLSSFRIRAW